MKRAGSMSATGGTGPCVRGGRGGGPAAFTLVELLVVIAILVLLLAILVPSTRYARETTQKIICASNLNQIGQAGVRYWSEHDGIGVRIHPQDVPDVSNACFNDALLPYCNDCDELFYCPIQSETPNAATNGRRLDYGMNHYGRAVNDDSLFLPTLGEDVRIYQVANSDAIYFADAENDNSPEDIGGACRDMGEVWPIYWSFENYAYSRHLDGYNCVQLDGTVRWYLGWPSTQEKWYIRRKVPH